MFRSHHRATIVGAAALGLVALWFPATGVARPMVLAAAPIHTDVPLHPGPLAVSFEPLRLAPAPTDDEPLVTLFAENTRERLDIRIPTDPDRIDEDTMAALRELFRCHRTGRRHRMDRNLMAALARISAHFAGREIEVVSGYRARPYGVPGSRHYRGKAIDFRVVGVDVEEVRTFVWDNLDDVGVGHYHQQGFIHLDVRRGEKIGWDQRREGQDYRYNPRWARPNS